MYVDNVFLCASLNIIGMIIPSLTYLRSHNNTGISDSQSTKGHQARKGKENCLLQKNKHSQLIRWPLNLGLLIQKIAIYREYKRLYGKVAKAAENWSQPTKLQSS